MTPYTDGVFSNITVIGPIKTGSSTSNANYGHAFDARRRTALSLFNSVLVGFPRGIRFNQPSVLAQYGLVAVYWPTTYSLHPLRLLHIT